MLADFNIYHPNIKVRSYNFAQKKKKERGEGLEPPNHRCLPVIANCFARHSQKASAGDCLGRLATPAPFFVCLESVYIVFDGNHP